jgi:hypothetical protein
MTWTPAQLRKWRGTRPQTKAAADMGLSETQYQKLEEGVSPILLRHELACEGWTARQRKK